MSFGEVTGASASLAEGLRASIAQVRAATTLPVAVGFGISSPAHVAAVGEVADGVVVGSALVRLIEEKAGDPGLPALLEARVRELCEPLRRKAERRRA